MKLLCLLTIVNVASGSLPEVDEVLTSADVQLLQATLSVETKPVVTTEDKVEVPSNKTLNYAPRSLLNTRHWTASESCSSDGKKNLEDVLVGEVVEQGTGQFVELAVEAMWAGTGPGGAFVGAIGGAFLSEHFITDPNEARFEALNGAITCLDERISANSERISKLTAQYNDLADAVASIGNMATADLDKSLKNAIEAVKNIGFQAEVCAKCLVKQKAPELIDKYPWSRNANFPMGAYPCYDVTHCDYDEFEAKINAHKSIEILDDLWHAVELIKKIWPHLRKPLKGSWGNYQPHEANYLKGLVLGLPSFFTAAAMIRPYVKLWADVLAKTLHEDDTKIHNQLRDKMRTFFNAIIMIPFGNQHVSFTWENRYHTKTKPVYSYSPRDFKPGRSFQAPFPEAIMNLENQYAKGYGGCGTRGLRWNRRVSGIDYIYPTHVYSHTQMGGNCYDDFMTAFKTVLDFRAAAVAGKQDLYNWRSFAINKQVLGDWSSGGPRRRAPPTRRRRYSPENYYGTGLGLEQHGSDPSEA